ncbi:MAG TPA: GSU2403 family nucleotidyltransferase fold protein [Oligoflexia bacterium]|nr:GSU2403 family nucleotidyltransferase fold protein [Oligoflexia bacterium]HMR25355.1 GSU2403 family nucleotidyltransferase fold protein [Oligoflexia bacterium]
MPDASFLLLLQTLKDLKPFLSHLVLVGGWVPYIYSQYVWKLSHIPRGTADIDFGLKDITYKGKSTIAHKLKQKQYGEHHINMGKLRPYIPVAKHGDERADVEFITSANPETFKSLVGKDIKINQIENFDLLLEKPLRMPIEGLNIQIPRPSIFIFHKLLTFVERQGQFKREKDLYYAYFMLLFHSDNEQVSQEIKQLILKKPQGKTVEKNIKNYFDDEFDQGPRIIGQQIKATSIQTFVKDVQQDSFERLRKLLP